MKRWLSVPVACLIAIAAVVVSAPTSSAAPYPRLDETAFAFWSFPTGEPGRTIEYGAALFRREDISTGEVTEYAGFFKARCVTEKIKRGTMTMCRGFAGERATDYYFDPLLQSAWMEGKNSRVEWTSTGPGLGMYFMEEGCYSESPEGEEEEGTGSGAGRYSDAHASGDVVGKDVSSARPRDQFAGLQIGAALTECSFFPYETMARIASGDRFRYSYQTRT